MGKRYKDLVSLPARMVHQPYLCPECDSGELEVSYRTPGVDWIWLDCEDCGLLVSMRAIGLYPGIPLVPSSYGFLQWYPNRIVTYLTEIGVVDANDKTSIRKVIEHALAPVSVRSSKA